MTRDDRIYDLIRILRDGRLHTAAELAATLGVSTRTIWRDMAVMAASGLPVEGARGLGYVLRAPVVLPPLILTQEELEALVAGLRHVAAGGGPGGRAARMVLAKVATVLPQAATAPPGGRAGENRGDG
jgi:predicted DNA-binding transcriptional regulator YafY